MSTKQAWVGFWILALIWGSSYFFIRIAVEQLPPFQLVFIRTAIAAVGLTVVVYLRGKRLPARGRALGDLLFLGVFNTVFPFALITWGETQIESGLASVLQGTTPLFSLVIAHFALADERISTRKIIGLVIGFLGIVILASRSTAAAASSPASMLQLIGQAAIMGSSLCYAIGGVYSRKAMQGRLEPIVVSAGAMIIAAIMTGGMAYVTPLFGGAAPVAFADMAPPVRNAVLTLGLLNTFGAYLLFYPLIAVLGASRTSMVTYIIPVVGLLLGALFLNEVIDLRLLVGGALIVGSIAIVNSKLPAAFKRSTAAAPAMVEEAVQ